MNDRIHIHQGTDRQWYWARKSRNGEVIAEGEGYTRRWSAKRAARRANPDNLWTWAPRDPKKEIR